MPNEINVRPVRAGMRLRHPVSGVLGDEGGRWVEDQFTYRRLRDGDIERADPPNPETSTKPIPEAAPEAASSFSGPASSRKKDS